MFQGAPHISDLVGFVLFYLQFAVILVQFVLVLYADTAALERSETVSKYGERSEETRPLLGQNGPVGGSTRMDSEPESKLVQWNLS